MDFSKDKMILRTIIMEHFEHPSCKVDENEKEDFLHYQNRSTTCVDNITAHLKVDSGKVIDAQFSGMGCAISTASSDIIANLLIGKTIVEAKLILQNYFAMMEKEEYDEFQLDELIAFYNIPNQPNRLKCAQIGVKAFAVLIDEYDEQNEN